MKVAKIEALATGRDYVDRLLAGMLEAIADLGYERVTVADIVRRARVSKRTFYEHFATKEACLLALYEAETSRMLDELEAAIRKLPPGEPRIVAGTAAYLARLQRRPRVVRTVALEILHLGEEGLALRRKVMKRFTALLMREFHAMGVRLSPAVATAIVGGVNELTLEALEDDRIDRLGDIGGAISEVVRGVLLLHEPKQKHARGA